MALPLLPHACAHTQPVNHTPSPAACVCYGTGCPHQRNACTTRLLECMYNHPLSPAACCTHNCTHSPAACICYAPPPCCMHMQPHTHLCRMYMLCHSLPCCMHTPPPSRQMYMLWHSPPLLHARAMTLPPLLHAYATTLPPLLHARAMTLPPLLHAYAMTLPPLLHASMTALNPLHVPPHSIPYMCHRTHVPPLCRPHRPRTPQSHSHA